MTRTPSSARSPTASEAPAGAGSVDARKPAFVSFEPPHGDGRELVAAPGSRRQWGGNEGHGLVAVGPGGSAASSGSAAAGILNVDGLPIQGAKIHPPPMRRDVLSRRRLNGWLDRHSTGRVVLVIAEAGFGKTTLLADWARHSPRRTLWYRLDTDDRDWLTFLRHLVGSGHEGDERYAADTLRMLNRLGPGGPTRSQLIEVFLRELTEAVAGEPRGLTLIFDDYHQVDGSAETDPIVRAILERTGPGLSVVISSRSTPGLPMGRLRAHGGVARLDGKDLCFNGDEAERLFRDAYQHPLDADVLAELLSRTEGWAAALGLARAAVEDRTQGEARIIVRQLSGARGDIHDYLAEEVLGGLDGRLQQFLLRASVLEAVDPALAEIADPSAGGAAEGLIDRAEALGLLTRPDERTPHRFHALVREFLVARLTAEIGSEAVAEVHHTLGRRLEGADWRLSATHYRLAGDLASARRVIGDALGEILGQGRAELARPLLDFEAAGDEARSVRLIILSRCEMARGDTDQSLALAHEAVSVSARASSRHLGIARLNLASLMATAGPRGDMVAMATSALSAELTESQREIGEAMLVLWEAVRDGDLRQAAHRLLGLAERQARTGQHHYAAITRLNLASVLFWVGDVAESLVQATEAEVLLADVPSSAERAAAVAARARALAYLYQLEEARRSIEQAATLSNPVGRFELLIEGAQIFAQFGALEDAAMMMERAGQPTGDLKGYEGPWLAARGEVAMRSGNHGTAAQVILRLEHGGLSADTAGLLRAKVLALRLAIATGESDLGALTRETTELATRQRSRIGVLLAGLLASVANQDGIDRAVTSLAPDERPVISMLAEELSSNLERISPAATRVVIDEALARPARWRSALLQAAEAGGESRAQVFSLLAEIGTEKELIALRGLAARAKPLRPAVAALARRLAPRVVVRDLGRIGLDVGERSIGPRGTRRKVLALLCFLISRPSMAATRDEIVEALWPDASPEAAANSLNQTIYFLRRVFEPGFKESLGAGYVGFDGEIVHLDPELIDSASRQCWRLATAYRRGRADVLDELLASYTGRFALDFAYEEWAQPHREGLHASVLAAAEQAVGEAMAEDRYDRAIAICQAVLAIDPDADAIELVLLRAYKAARLPAAAAEQYAHYVNVSREHLGVEPLPLDDL